MASKFSGIRNAWDYAYGVNPDAGPALQVISGPTVAGAGTLVVAPARDNTVDGLPVVPTTTTKIIVGNATTLETVTPTAVSYDSLGNILISATFANPHGAGDQVRSGTAGVQEAIEAAHVVGGLVSVDAKAFKALGITTNAAVGTYLTSASNVVGYLNISVLNWIGITGAVSYASASNGAALAAKTAVLY